MLAEASDFLQKKVGAATAQAAIVALTGRGEAPRAAAAAAAAAPGSSSGASTRRAACGPSTGTSVQRPTLLAGSLGTAIAATAATPQMMQQRNLAAAAVSRSRGATGGIRPEYSNTINIISTRNTGWQGATRMPPQKRSACTSTGGESGGSAYAANGVAEAKVGSAAGGADLFQNAKRLRSAGASPTPGKKLDMGRDDCLFDCSNGEEAHIRAHVDSMLANHEEGSPPPAPPAPSAPSASFSSVCVEEGGIQSGNRTAGAGAGARSSAECQIPTPPAAAGARSDEEVPATIDEGEEWMRLNKPPLGGWGFDGKDAIMYFDGGSRGNPGPAGAGAVLYVGGVERKDEVGYVLAPLGLATNNQSEYVGMIVGMRLAQRLGVKRLRVKGDSKLAINQVQGFWKTNMNLEIAALAKKLKAEFDHVSFTHVKRELNKRADALSNAAMDAIVTNPRQFEASVWVDELPPL